MGILGEDKAGKKGSDDGGEAYFFRGNTEKQTDAQGHDQMRIAGREPLQSRRDASHDARSYIDHEKGKADGEPQFESPFEPDFETEFERIFKPGYERKVEKHVNEVE